MQPASKGSGNGAVTAGDVRDAYSRPLRNLRISVTDKCNLRCQYCMPEEEYTWLPRQDLLTFEEISRLADVFMALGVDKLRITGGEPLLRRELPELIRLLSAKQRLRDLAITTNGVKLVDHVESLRDAGMRRFTISLDTLRPDRFEKLSRRTTHSAVIEGIRSVPAAGLTDTKLDTVVMKGINHDELVDLIEFGKTVPAEVRFIEYMDVGGATGWNKNLVYSRREMLGDLQAHYGQVDEIRENEWAPADRFALPDGTTFGIISSTTQPFCSTCDRSRLTADGQLLTCLYAITGTDLRTPMRDGASHEELCALVGGLWSGRRDRGAVDRLTKKDERSVFVAVGELKKNPHLEMHTRGG
ncbi:GTP 3',8-cyclase MoaA [Lentzea sp. NPDC051208]|uniref:GTP 3',8-cyclase MoaA n=1 Tax=Lentzea sp. NPDC051208 TaxID=3154642 RepID=UPI00344444BE